MTTMMMVVPATKAIQGASCRYFLPSPMMFPQVGVGGITPSPKKPRLASAMTAAGIHRVAKTRIGAQMFGRM
ncbi:MAG: hypothetical protein A3H48_03125 [Candidatus Rokubacteria bacterium RIFCSPLOWO2_02_FULL_71_18]|nr:MAG: hypothetical protein A3H48_03125 [Candidatus Rokubacteria bacterium RIFCSPLOWO2_02_FULL_71_18]